MVIGFKHQFVQQILSGDKIHTLREDRHNRWESGKLMQMYTDVRTKKMKLFNATPCVDTQNVIIAWARGLDCVDDAQIIIVDGRILNYNETIEFAKNDGFKNVKDFEEWFKNDCEMKLIHWTDKKY